MKTEELTKPLGLEEKHFNRRSIDIPIIDTSLYTTLGRKLFELYQKHQISPEDQREFERLSFLLLSFTISRDQKPKSFWAKFRGLWCSK